MADSDHRAVWTEEVKALRQHHNFAPYNAIADVALTLHAVVGDVDFERCLATLPAFATDYWSASVPNPD
jgi:hypothetical protein